MKCLNILFACEESQTGTKIARAMGHNAFSCDLLDCSGGHPEWHIKGDAIEALYSRRWDLVIAHPPCTRLANSGVRWLASRKPKSGYSWNEEGQIYLRDDRQIWLDLVAGSDFFMKFVEYGKEGNRILIENPVPHSYALLPEYSQTVQPWMFGDMETKRTCFWLYNLPNIVGTKDVYKQMMKLPYKDRAKIHYASPGKDRAKIRSKSFNGMMEAIVDQFTKFIQEHKVAA